MMKSNSLKNKKMIFILLIVSVFLAITSVVFPSLANFNNKNALEVPSVWGGDVSVGYREGDGSKENPYLISNGADLAYFQKMLNETDYAGVYFSLGNDILINEGIFGYENENFTYTLDGTKYYVKEFTNELYNDDTYEGVSVNSINYWGSFKNFKGNFNGNFHTIYGLYNYSLNDEVGVFTNLSDGRIENVFISNVLLYGKNSVGGLASTAANENISNVMVSGNVIGITSDDKKVKLNDISKSSLDEVVVISKDALMTEDLTKATLSGICNNNFSINGNEVDCIENSFNYELSGNEEELVIDALEDLSLTDIYIASSLNEVVVGGIVGNASSLTMENTINKANVYSSNLGTGLIATSDGNNIITNSYNMGDVTASISAGIIGKSESTSSLKISNVYNKGVINGDDKAGIINNISSVSNVKISNTLNFDSNSSMFGSITNSSVEVSNCYNANSNIALAGRENIVGDINTITSEVMNSDFMKNDLAYKEYLDREDALVNKENVWTYNDEGLPILYMESLNDITLRITIGSNSWDDLRSEVKTINLSSTQSFAIDMVSSVQNVKEKYYYISDRVLTNEEILGITDWTLYDNIGTLSQEGKYVIYAKYVDFDDNVGYLNSDMLVIDMTKGNVLIKNDKNSWNSLNDNPGYVFVNSVSNFEIEASDNLSGIKSIEYFVASSNVTDINSIDWVTYEKWVSINEEGKYIIYVKVVDNALNETIINTDYIVYGGYNLVDMNGGGENKDVLNITDRSKVYYHFVYNDSIDWETIGSRHLIFNQVMPIGTKIILRDNMDNKVYSYVVSTEKTDFAFKDFEEIGKMTMEEYFSDQACNERNEEDFMIEVDFEEAIITRHILGIQAKLSLLDDDGKVVRSTLIDTVKSANLYLDSKARPFIRSSYNSEIKFNSDSVNTIDLNVGITNSYIDEAKIEDTVYNNYNLGIEISLIDENEEIISKNKLKNVEFKIGNNTYYPDNDGIVRIKLQNGISDLMTSLDIITYKNVSELVSGNYYFRIVSKATYDGLYGGDKSLEEIRISVVNEMTSEEKKYNFDVQMNSEDKVLYKEDKIKNIKFNIIRDELLENMKVKVFLYKKDLLTAYDQKYSLINLSDYTTSLTDGIGSNYELDLDVESLVSGGYKFVFELIDGEKRVRKIEKTFIVR